MPTATTNQLWFNADDEADKNLSDSSRFSVCQRLIISAAPSQAPSVDTSTSPTFDVNSFPTRNPTRSPSIMNELPSSSPTSSTYTTSSILTSMDDSVSTTSGNSPNEYYLSETGRCTKISEFISTKEECAVAASILNLSDNTVQQITNEDRPFGCYFISSGTSNQLWFNADEESGKTVDDSSRKSVCRKSYMVDTTAETTGSSLGDNLSESSAALFSLTAAFSLLMYF